MIANDNVTVFEHVHRDLASRLDWDDPPRMFMVNFDGEWDQWFSQLSESAVTPEVEKACLAELSAYYKKDWAETGRILDVVVLKVTGRSIINCK